ncbi:proline-rich protein 1-like [Cynara cardunculus var. scolymus]|uniref:proline-rich protein 1-like n=1 Tax=Cynara cardunculus var. scolymus TaxID=59895 RepID=UPI000D62F43B|nr:proline-rich protein 1-like [Cynara cardunculus var. scolymus]
MVVSTSAGGGYGVAPATKPAAEIPYYKMTKQNEISKPIAIQGLIYCKSGSKLTPLKGAIARITCLARNRKGLELAPFSIVSCPADNKGYFLAKLSPPSMKFLKNVDWELEECKAFLKSSPLKDCKIPLDVNGGITGAHIVSSSSHRLLKNANLYSLKPFFYMSGQPQKVSDDKGY